MLLLLWHGCRKCGGVGTTIGWNDVSRGALVVDFVFEMGGCAGGGLCGGNSTVGEEG